MQNTRIGPFQLVEKIGTNRRQKVFRAVQVEQRREVVLKFVKIPPNVPRSRALSRIQRENKILRKLQHPNLVQVFGAGVEDPDIFFAMEMVHGESLSHILMRRGQLAWDLAVEYAKQMAMGLEYVHNQDLLHLKLSPEKVLIREDGLVKITDLRLNRTQKKRWDTKDSDNAMEKAAYIAPEQLLGQGGSNKCDFYSLGVILYEMLTGKLPYAQDTMAQLIKAKQTEQPLPISDFNLNCPIWLEKIVSQLLSIDPARRPHTAKAIVLALQEVQDIDSSGTGVAEKLTGTFNPLTAGIDKSEARKLLGYKEKKIASPALWTNRKFQIGALIGSLAIIMLFLAWMLQPVSDANMFAKAQQLVESESRDDWTTAKLSYIQPLMERGEDRAYYKNCVSLLNLIEYKKLRNRIESGPRVRSTDTANEKRLFSAVAYRDEENFPSALRLLQMLIKENDPHQTDGYIVQIASEMEQEILLEVDRRRIEVIAAAGKSSTNIGVPENENDVTETSSVPDSELVPEKKSTSDGSVMPETGMGVGTGTDETSTETEAIDENPTKDVLEPKPPSGNAPSDTGLDDRQNVDLSPFATSEIELIPAKTD